MDRPPANVKRESLPVLLEVIVELIETVSLNVSKSNLRTYPAVEEQLKEAKKLLTEFEKEKK